MATESESDTMQEEERIGARLHDMSTDSGSGKRKHLAPVDDHETIQERMKAYKEDGWVRVPLKGEGNKMQQYGVVLQRIAKPGDPDKPKKKWVCCCSNGCLKEVDVTDGKRSQTVYDHIAKHGVGRMEDHSSVKSKKQRSSGDSAARILGSGRLATASMEEKRSLIGDLLSIPAIWDEIKPNSPLAGLSGGAMSMRFDKKENLYVVEAATPGVAREELIIEIVGERRVELIVEQVSSDGEQKDTDETGQPVRKYYGFVVLPDDADTSNERVDYANGLLRIRFPKMAEFDIKKLQSEMEGEHTTLTMELAARHSRVKELRVQLDAELAEAAKAEARLKQAREAAARERSSKRRRLGDLGIGGSSACAPQLVALVQAGTQAALTQAAQAASSQVTPAHQVLVAHAVPMQAATAMHVNAASEADGKGDRSI